MKRINVFVVLLLQSAFLMGNGSIAFAQNINDVTERIPLAEPQLTETDQNHSEASIAPIAASGVINISADPSDIERRLPEEPSGERENSQAPVLVTPPPLREQATSVFVLTGVEITGVTVFSPQTFAPLYDNLLARAINVQDVAKIVDSITDTYRKQGYFLSRATAPAQSGESGVLKIHVSEGYISTVAVKGGGSLIKKLFQGVTNERPLKLSTLERALALAGDLNGVAVAATEIEPDLTDLARHQLVVTIKHDPLEASAYMDNRGIKAAGPIQTYVSAAANSVVTTGDQLKIGIFTIPDDPGELALAEVSYQTPLFSSGAFAKISGMSSKFDAGASLAALDTETRTKRIAFNLSYPVIRTRKTSLWANLGFEGRNIEEEQSGVPVFEDKIRVLSAWANFRSDHWNGYTTLFGKVSQGLDMIGATVGQASLSRPDATGEFTKFEAQISRYQNIGKAFGFYASLTGQTALDPLLASEEFSLGGARYGRAYDYSELTGDDGVAALVELRYGRNPNMSFLKFYQLYAFFDHGVVWNDNAAPGFEELALSSAGAGLRLTFPDALSANVEAAKPLDRTPFTQGDQDWRLFFSLSKQF